MMQQYKDRDCSAFVFNKKNSTTVAIECFGRGNSRYLSAESFCRFDLKQRRYFTC